MNFQLTCCILKDPATSFYTFRDYPPSCGATEYSVFPKVIVCNETDVDLLYMAPIYHRNLIYHRD